MMTVINYAAPGPLTGLGEVSPAALHRVASDPVGICRLATELVIQPGDAKEAGLPSQRYVESQLRPVGSIVSALVALDPAPLDVPREPARKVIGTCRHFVVLSVALLRYRGIPARARCGFGTCFQPGLGLDHWITEYWHAGEGRWVRVDTEHLNRSFVAHPEDLRPGEFLTGGEAWAAHRAGRIDAAKFGVYGTENFGPAEIRGNAIRDLPALNKVETLPWDEWGRMTASYQGETGADYDELMDAIASVTRAGDQAAIAELYATADLRVPPELIC